MNEKDFQVQANHLQGTYQAQLDLSRSCCDLGLKCCVGLADLSSDATKGVLALAEAVRERLLDRTFSEFVTQSSGRSFSLWTLWLQAGVEVQKGVMSSLTNR